MNLRTEKIDYKTGSNRDLVLYTGIVDDKGIDILMTSDRATGQIVHNMFLRVRMNPHRNARVFVCSINKKYVQDFKSIEPIQLYKLLKKISVKFVEDIDE